MSVNSVLSLTNQVKATGCTFLWHCLHHVVQVKVVLYSVYKQNPKGRTIIFLEGGGG